MHMDGGAAETTLLAAIIGCRIQAEFKCFIISSFF